jgi:hypothetical protein
MGFSTAREDGLGREAPSITMIASTDLVPDPTSRPLLGGRYALLDEIGRGAMGVVHRAQDRLDGSTVTIKLAHQPSEDSTGSTLPPEVLLSLAHEFAVLASLRHPNVIRVFDYGFDRERGPYVVMEHRPDADTLLHAAADATRGHKLALLLDLLRALAYLHRRGIIHRDVKPENVLVTGGHAKVVDFGLSLPIEQIADDLAGTAPYLAPELLLGGAPSALSDLWAVGVIAVELFGGHHPFDGPQLLAGVLHREPDLGGMPGDVEAVARRLLAKAPAARYASATDAAEAFAGISAERVAVETVETRESFLQASRFVGRARELGELMDVIAPLAGGSAGGVWLLGGESGVGKSRLADEAATRALIGGVRVLRGQAVSDAGSPYEVWRPVLRGLCLTAAPTNAEAALLRIVLPDVEALLGRPTSPTPSAEDAAVQTQLLATVEDMVGRERIPTLVILEDLQWAGSESLRLLTWIARALARSPVMVLGTFRDDEAPRLPAGMDEAHLLHLGRLSRDAVSELARAIVGPAAADDELVDGLAAETEGNPFFLVETLRAIANEVGRLEALGARHLHPEIPAEGVRRIVERRLAQLAPETRTVLQIAALAGRQLDPAVLARACGEPDFEKHLQAATDSAIVEARGGALEFAHDKLREALTREVDAPRRAAAHARLAAAIEVAYGGGAAHVAALAHHWEAAGDEARSMRYASLAGAQALAGGAFAEAVRLLGRARAYALRRAGAERRALLFGIDAHLTEAHYQLGDLAAARQHGELALGHAGDATPAGALGKAWITAREAATRVAQTIRPEEAPPLPPEDLARYARVLIVLSECYMFAMEAQAFTIAALRLTNRTAPAGPSAALARGWQDLGMLAMTTPWKRTARRWVDRAIEMARVHGAENDHAFVLSRAGVLAITTARWDDAEGAIRRAVEVATNHGDRRLLDECAVLIPIIRFFQGRHGEAAAGYAEAEVAARRNGTRQVERWSALGLADVALRRGRTAEAITRYDRELASGGVMATELVWGHGMRALARLRAGDRAGAEADALASLALLDQSPPVAYWIQHGVHATALTLLALSPPRRASRAALRGVLHAGILGSVVRLAEPAAALLQGELLRRVGAERSARRAFARGARLAGELEMAYDAALAAEALGEAQPEGLESAR